MTSYQPVPTHTHTPDPYIQLPITSLASSSSSSHVIHHRPVVVKESKEKEEEALGALEMEKRGLLRSASVEDDEQDEQDQEDEEYYHVDERQQQRLHQQHQQYEEDDFQDDHRSPRTPPTITTTHVVPISHDLPAAATSSSSTLPSSSSSPHRRSKSSKGPHFASSRKARPWKPLPFCIRWAGLIGSSVIMACGLIAAALYLGVLHRHPSSSIVSSTSSSSPEVIVALTANATAVLNALNQTRTEFESSLEARRAALAEHEQLRLKQQEEFRLALEKFDADLKRLAEARSKMEKEDKKVVDLGADIAGTIAAGSLSAPPPISSDIPTKPTSPSGSGPILRPALGVATGAASGSSVTTDDATNNPPIASSPPSSPSSNLQLCHPLNVHMLARLYDKLLLGWPITIGVISNSKSEALIRNSTAFHYAQNLVSWLNVHFPVQQNDVLRVRVGLPSYNTALAHEVQIRLVEDLGALASHPECLQHAFDDPQHLRPHHPKLPSMPDLLLLDLSLVTLPLPKPETIQVADIKLTRPRSEADKSTLERRIYDVQKLIHYILETSERQREADLPAKMKNETKWIMGDELRHHLQGTALFFLHFDLLINQTKGQTLEMKPTLDKLHQLARVYAIPEISPHIHWKEISIAEPSVFRDRSASSAHSTFSTVVVGPGSVNHLVSYFVRETFLSLWENYLTSERTSFEGTLFTPRYMSSTTEGDDATPRSTEDNDARRLLDVFTSPLPTPTQLRQTILDEATAAAEVIQLHSSSQPPPNKPPPATSGALLPPPPSPIRAGTPPLSRRTTETTSATVDIPPNWCSTILQRSLMATPLLDAAHS